MLKGYVNISDVIYFFIFYGVITVVLCGLVYSFYQGYLIIVSGNILDATYQVSSINEKIGAFGITVLLIITVISFIGIVAYIGTIKIAKCEYKKDDENE